MALTKVSLLDDPLAMSYAANVAGNVSVTRSLAVGYTDGRVPQANLDVKGNTSISGNVAFGSSTSYPDSSSGGIGKAVFGAGRDLQIFHDGSNSYIKDVGTGSLISWSSATYIRGSSGEDMIKASTGGAVDLYYANSRKMTTTTTGVTVLNTLTSNFGANVVGNVSVTRSMAVGYTDGRVPQANLEVTGNTVISGSSYPNGGGLWIGRNIFINGAATVAQRSTSVSSITTAGYKTIDRFYLNYGAMGTWTQSRATDVPAAKGFGYSLKMDCTSADASPASSDKLLITQSIVGQNLQKLKKGTASAESITISFWVKSGKTGVHIVEIYDNDNTRSISKSYTISSADTWEYNALTFPGDTSGTLTNDDNTSLTVGFWLGAGSNFTSGTLATSWASATNANRAVGQVNVADSASNDWLITGIQVEMGSSATPYEHETYEQTLHKCLRYYYKWESSTAYAKVGLGRAWDTSNTAAQLDLPVPMRASPTLTYSALGDFAIAGIGGTPAAITNDQRTTDFRSIGLNINQGSTPFTTGTIYQLEADNNAGSELEFSAEL